MRTRTFALVALTAGLTLAAAHAVPPVEYRQFASSAGRYKVLFPGPVKTETTEIKTPAGATLAVTLDAVDLGEGVIFMVTYVDTPGDVAKAPPGPRLDRVRDGNKGADGKVVSDKDLTVGAEKYPARDVLIEKPDAALRNRIVIAGSRLYQVIIQGPKTFVTSREADRFFDSFEVTR